MNLQPALLAGIRHQLDNCHVLNVLKVLNVRTELHPHWIAILVNIKMVVVWKLVNRVHQDTMLIVVALSLAQFALLEVPVLTPLCHLLPAVVGSIPLLEQQPAHHVLLAPAAQDQGLQHVLLVNTVMEVLVKTVLKAFHVHLLCQRRSLVSMGHIRIKLGRPVALHALLENLVLMLVTLQWIVTLASTVPLLRALAIVAQMDFTASLLPAPALCVQLVVSVIMVPVSSHLKIVMLAHTAREAKQFVLIVQQALTALPELLHVPFAQLVTIAMILPCHHKAVPLAITVLKGRIQHVPSALLVITVQMLMLRHKFVHQGSTPSWDLQHAQIVQLVSHVLILLSLL